MLNNTWLGTLCFSDTSFTFTQGRQSNKKNDVNHFLIPHAGDLFFISVPKLLSLCMHGTDM